jgi:hypothetical protein
MFHPRPTGIPADRARGSSLSAWNNIISNSSGVLTVAVVSPLSVSWDRNAACREPWITRDDRS